MAGRLGYKLLISDRALIRAGKNNLRPDEPKLNIKARDNLLETLNQELGNAMKNEAKAQTAEKGCFGTLTMTPAA